jgi:hypothetical protein
MYYSPASFDKAVITAPDVSSTQMIGLKGQLPPAKAGGS